MEYYKGYLKSFVSLICSPQNINKWVTGIEKGPSRKIQFRKNSVRSFNKLEWAMNMKCQCNLIANVKFQCVSRSDASFIRKLLQWTTSLRWMKEVLHVLKMKYFIQELLRRFLLHLLNQVHFVHYSSIFVQSRLYVEELR